MKSLSVIFLVLVFVSCQKQQNEDINKAKQASIDSMQTEISKQKVIDSMQLEIAKINVANERPQHVTVVNPPVTATAAPAKKKGWSGAAKGAVIGAGVGAATGAIVSKKKGQGAIIGGLVGAGVGAGTGAIIDDTTKNKDNK
jgi:hypothetical protein